MKKFKSIIFRKTTSSFLSLLVLSASVLANTKCCYIFHDKEKPEGLNEFRKY